MFVLLGFTALRFFHYTAPRLRRPARSEPLRPARVAGANGGLDAATPRPTTAMPLGWPRATRGNGTTPPAWHTPAPDADAGGCRTPVNNTPKYGLLTLHYSWHRLHGHELSVVRLICKQGVQICRCAEPGRVGLPSIELPAWMFDRVHCTCMRRSISPSVNLQALRALQQLLCECKDSPIVEPHTSVQTGSQPQIGDTDVDETQPAVQTAGSLRNDPGPTPVGQNPHHRSKGTSPAAPGDVVQSSSAATARATSEGRPA